MGLSEITWSPAAPTGSGYGAIACVGATISASVEPIISDAVYEVIHVCPDCSVQTSRFTVAPITTGRYTIAGPYSDAGEGLSVSFSSSDPGEGEVVFTLTATMPSDSPCGANPSTVTTGGAYAVLSVHITGFSLDPTWALGNGCDAAKHRSTCTATIRPAGLSTITYSIQGNPHGATIDPSTGVITPGVGDSGIITVRATATIFPACFDEARLLIRAIPTGIASTRIDTPNLDYGAIYTHTCSSSGGSLEGVEITEIVTVSRDDFNTRWGGVPEGTITATINAAGEISDIIETPSAWIDANDFLPSPPKSGLPAVLDTPQVLEWWCPLDNDWIPFANVAITAILSEQGTNLIFTTTDNGIPCTEPYSGPPVTP